MKNESNWEAKMKNSTKLWVCLTLVFMLVLGFSFTLPAQAANEWFVSPAGSASGAGTMSSPWALQTALNGGPSGSNVRPGDTIWLRGGTYTGSFTSYLTGTAAAPIIVRNYNNERVILEAFHNDEGTTVLTVNQSAYVWFWGFEVTNPFANPTDPSQWAGNTGISVGGSGGAGTKFINLILHDNIGSGIDNYDPAYGSEVYGTLAFFNGRAIHPNHGYGIYTQNGGSSPKVIEDNIFIHNFGEYDIHAYGQAGSLINFVFRGNAWIGSFFLGGSESMGQNNVIDSNFGYGDDADVFHQVMNLGYVGFGPGVRNTVLTNNYIAGGAFLYNTGNAGTSMTGNTVVGTLSGFTSSNFPNNNYYLATWPDPAPHPSPSGVKVFVRPNKYEAGRANIIIYNWDNANTANVDVSNVLNNGDTYEIRDAQNWFGTPIQTGTYTGGSISVPLTSMAFAKPVSIPPNPFWGGISIPANNSTFLCF